MEAPVEVLFSSLYLLYQLLGCFQGCALSLSLARCK